MDTGKSTRIGLANGNHNRAWLSINLGVSKAYVSAICNGKEEPSRDMIKRLAEVFNVPVSTFIKWGE